MSVRMIDTHCHLNMEQYDTDYHEILDTALGEGVAVIMPGCDLESSKKSVAIATEYAGKPVWSAIGQHPTDTAEGWSEEEYGMLARSPQVVAIGEIGLDYFHLPQDTDSREHGKAAQKEVLRKQLALAHQVQKPVIIHCRDAHDDMVQEFVDHYGVWTGDRERGVIHCFTGTAHDAKNYLDLGFLISFTGIITFTEQYATIIKEIPLEKLLIETDSPFLTPVPYRGKRNDPRYVEYVAQKIAEYKGISFEETITQTFENARRLFGLTLAQ